MMISTSSPERAHAITEQIVRSRAIQFPSYIRHAVYRFTRPCVRRRGARVGLCVPRHGAGLGDASGRLAARRGPYLDEIADLATADKEAAAHAGKGRRAPLWTNSCVASAGTAARADRRRPSAACSRGCSSTREQVAGADPRDRSRLHPRCDADRARDPALRRGRRRAPETLSRHTRGAEEAGAEAVIDIKPINVGFGVSEIPRARTSRRT